MKDYEQLFNQIADEYALMLLNWAYKKIGDREKAEDLAQEVLLQVFLAIKNEYSAGKKVDKLENLVWKVAHYVWCHHLRRLTYRMYENSPELTGLVFYGSNRLMSCGNRVALRTFSNPSSFAVSRSSPIPISPCIGSPYICAIR